MHCSTPWEGEGTVNIHHVSLNSIGRVSFGFLGEKNNSRKDGPRGVCFSLYISLYTASGHCRGERQRVCMGARSSSSSRRNCPNLYYGARPGFLPEYLAISGCCARMMETKRNHFWQIDIMPIVEGGKKNIWRSCDRSLRLLQTVGIFTQPAAFFSKFDFKVICSVMDARPTETMGVDILRQLGICALANRYSTTGKKRPVVSNISRLN